MLPFSKTVFRSLIFIGITIPFVFSPYDLLGAQSGEMGIIVAKRLPIRSEPDELATRAFVLKAGTRVKIVKHLNGWLEIVHDGKAGYVQDLEVYVRVIGQKGREGKKNKRILRLKGETKQIGRKIKERKLTIQAITEKETVYIRRFNKIDQSLNRLRKKVSHVKSELFNLEKNIAEIMDRSKALTKEIESIEEYASRRLVALYKLSWMGSTNLLASADSFYELIHLKKGLERILVHDENIRADLIDKEVILYRLLNEMNVNKKKKQAIEAAYDDQIKAISEEQQKRSGLLSEIRNKKSLQIAAIKALKDASGTLDQTIKSLSRKQKPFQPLKKMSQKPFRALKGLLNIPVEGKIVDLFGSYNDARFNIVNFRSGIGIETEQGEPIHAVRAGRVIFSGWFNGYGNMMIIDHGESYSTVYAHAHELFKKLDDIVDTHEVIATVGETGSMAGPKLYFEMRHRGKPVDPLEWMKKG
ncbi:MAG: peptidoglycan DD-metalloendopeptidase family protein [Desulfobacterales bacterium]|jgi:septal ring factor EnvC (AmiA/AmiB activator)|nr:peptidoglycan DD-metalloendopeptidase family protein [Desulfobacterales bacterium]MDP6683082.1 peptidoglycan DD-metalloendopeptidase family protein [Desulfobacterales bacterium]MDP6806497.1 peptidoglycan DD-metalloendopeptidase family protein [Desulfobacterales bacterium]|tara:strand:+ start:143285 stop:144700 length:1416 start_codon:yes stop_codon:yes gene_type:complete